MLNNSDLEIWVRGHSRSFKLVVFKSLGAASYLPSIVTMALSCIISETKGDIVRKLGFYSYPFDSTPLLGGFHTNIAILFVCLGLPGGKKILICSAVSTEYRHVTNRQTDGQWTSCDGIVCARHTRHAVKTIYQATFLQKNEPNNKHFTV